MSNIFGNASSCLDSTGSNFTSAVLMGRVLPYLVNGLLYGGIHPYVVHISSSKRPKTEYLVTYDCDSFLSETILDYSRHVTDVIVLVNCHIAEVPILFKIHEKLSENLSPMARPNVVVLIQTSEEKILPANLTHKFMKFVNNMVNVYNLKITANEDIIGNVQHFTQPGLSPLSTVLFIPRKMKVELVTRPLNFHGKLFRVKTNPYSPFVNGYRTIDDYEFSGYIISVLHALAEKYNFRYELGITWLYGSKQEDGRWNGMVGELQNQQTDIVAAAMTITSQRSEVIDFTIPIWFAPLAAAVKIKTSKLFYLFRPLHDKVWLAAGGTLIVTIVCYFLLEACAVKLGKTKFEILFHHDWGWHIITRWLNQSPTTEPVLTSIRFFSGILSFSLVAFWAVYAGNLIASLSVHKPTVPLKSLRELAESTEYLPLIEQDSVAETLFKDSTEGVYAKVWESIQRNTPETICWYGRLCQEQFGKSNNFVYIGDKTGVIVGAIEQEAKCEAQLLPEEFYPSGLGIALPLGSPYKPFFDDAILKMREAGLLLKFEDMNKLPDDQCAESRKRMVTSHALTIPEISAAFLILGVGVITSLFVFYLEYSWPCTRNITTKIRDGYLTSGVY